MLRRLAGRIRRRLARRAAPEAEFHAEIAVPVERLGTEYGGWEFCPTAIDGDAIVYSFGIGEDVSFEIALIAKYRVGVHAFDPTPRSLAWVRSQELPRGLEVHDYGLAARDGYLKLFPPVDPSHVSHSLVRRGNETARPLRLPVRRLKTIMESLGHDRVDLVKMDIEGAEYAVIDDIVRCRLDVPQLLVEFHHRFPEFGPARTARAVRALGRAGYRVFAISASGEEFSFLRPS